MATKKALAQMKSEANIGRVEAKRNAKLRLQFLEYRNIFMLGTDLRTRIDTIMEGNPDPMPGTCNSALIEQMLRALSRNQKNPIPLNKLKGNGQEVVDENAPALLPRIHVALAALFTVERQLSR